MSQCNHVPLLAAQRRVMNVGSVFNIKERNAKETSLFEGY